MNKLWRELCLIDRRADCGYIIVLFFLVLGCRVKATYEVVIVTNRCYISSTVNCHLEDVENIGNGADVIRKPD